MNTKKIIILAASSLLLIGCAKQNSNNVEKQYRTNTGYSTTYTSFASAFAAEISTLNEGQFGHVLEEETPRSFELVSEKLTDYDIVTSNQGVTKEETTYLYSKENTKYSEDDRVMEEVTESYEEGKTLVDRKNAGNYSEKEKAHTVYTNGFTINELEKTYTKTNKTVNEKATSVIGGLFDSIYQTISATLMSSGTNANYYVNGSLYTIETSTNVGGYSSDYYGYVKTVVQASLNPNDLFLYESEDRTGLTHRQSSSVTVDYKKYVEVEYTTITTKQMKLSAPNLRNYSNSDL